MTPGLAFFYGGMVRDKSVLNMLMMSIGSIGVVGVVWLLYGYSAAFGPDLGAGLLGDHGMPKASIKAHGYWAYGKPMGRSPAEPPRDATP